MKTLLMLLTVALLFIASPMTAVNFAVQPQIETQLSLERTEAISTGVLATMLTGYELRCRGGGLRFNSTPGRNLPTGEQMKVTSEFLGP